MSKNFLGALLSVAAFACGSVAAADFSPELIKRGEQTYVLNCSRCHGIRLVNPSGYNFDLRTFPADQPERFFNSVARGKDNMPAWGDLLNADQIKALWAYVRTEGGRSP